MEKTGINRREFERFNVNALAEVELEGQAAVRKLSARDISAGGTFLYSKEPPGEGAQLKLEIFIPNETILNLTGTQFQLHAQGVVVRTEQGGMAVRFLWHKILPLSS